MGERPIAFQSLHKDELIHEVRIRDAVPADDVAALRVQIRTLVRDIPTDTITSFEGKIETELSVIRLKFAELKELIKSLVWPRALKNLVRIQALAHHLFHRLTRLEPELSEHKRVCAEVNEELAQLLTKLDNMFSTFDSCKESSDPEVGPVVSSAVTPVGKHQLVSSLNLKYNGTTCVRAFLQRLEELCTSRDISEERLFGSAAEIFDGEVLCWYRGVKSELHDWSDLKQSLIDEFLPYDFDRRLMQEIRLRTQGPHENIVTYVAIMQNLFSRLSYTVSEGEMFDTVFQNVRPEYTLPLATTEITTLKRLKQLCRMLECAKYRAQAFVEPPKSTSGLLAPDLACKSVKVVKPVHEMVAAVNKFCARCRVESHSLSECTSKAVVCFRCGKQGFTALRCPICKPVPVIVAKADAPLNAAKN